jgi:hypothetical protein
VALLLASALVALAWMLGALQLSPRTRRIGDALPWLAGALAGAVAACVLLGLAGMLLQDVWQPPSNGQALHRLLGEGSLAMRRTGWTALDRTANVYLGLGIAWTLLALCLASMYGLVFWAGVAERRRRAAARRAR